METEISKTDEIDSKEPQVPQFEEILIKTEQIEDASEDLSNESHEDGPSTADDKLHEWLQFLFHDSHGDVKLVDWLMNVGLISNRYECPKCGDTMKLLKNKQKSDGYVWACRKRGNNDGHRILKSLRKGSWFEESKLSMRNILLITYMWSIQMSTLSIIKELKVSCQTVTDWKSFCREVCVEICARDNDMLGGQGIIVEIDESEFGKRKYNRGKRVEGRWVFGGVERGTNKCFMRVVENRSKELLLEVIKEHILPGTTIISDCWRSYDCLEDEGFQHFKVNNSVEFLNKEAGAHTNTIESTWADVKRSFYGKNYCRGQFDSYLFEYMLRRKYSQSKTKFIDIFLHMITQIYTPSVHD